MSFSREPSIEERYVYFGVASGVGGRLTKLDNKKGLDHVIPVQGASALPVIGGLSSSVVENFTFDVQDPKPMRVLSIGAIRTSAKGEWIQGVNRTEVMASVHNVDLFVDKLHIDEARGTLISTHKKDDLHPSIEPGEAAILGLRLGKRKVTVTIDTDVYRRFPTKKALGDRFGKDKELREQHAGRFNASPKSRRIPEYKGYYVCSIVSKIEVEGGFDKEIQRERNDYTLRWKDVGLIILGELLMRDESRRLTMVRLKLGSPDEADIAFAEPMSNGGGVP